MSILVYTENWDGKFKKVSFELITYANELAKKLNTSVTALSIGQVSEEELKKLGTYGASKILSVTDEKLITLDNQSYTSVIAQAVAKENAAVVLFAQNNAWRKRSFANRKKRSRRAKQRTYLHPENDPKKIHR